MAKHAAKHVEEVDLATFQAMRQEATTVNASSVSRGVNNRDLILKKMEDIDYKVPDGAKRVPWVDTLAVDATAELPKGTTEKAGVKLETAFLNAATEAAKEAYRRLRVMKIPCARPGDFYAEMLKTDKQMHKVKELAAEETRRIKIVEERRKSQAAKKFTKNAKAKKLKAKADEKRQSLDDISKWRASTKKGNNEDEQDLEDILQKGPGGKVPGKKGETVKSKKRAVADKKFGFGGKKRFAKQNDKKSVDEKPKGKGKGKGKGQGKGKSKSTKGSGKGRGSSAGKDGQASKKRRK